MQANMSIGEQLRLAKPEPTAKVISLGIFLGLMTVLTIGGNLLVILAVSLVKKLRTPSNFLIVSLAVSDLLVGLTAMPFAVFTELVGSWPLGEAICDAYIAFDVLLCTASILNLCAISIDRYLAITRPLQYAAKRTPKRMMLMIAIVWVASALISIPPMFGFKETFIPGMCGYSSNIIYQIYATCGAFYIPLIVMIVLYGRIFILARHMAQEDAKQKRVTDSVANQSSYSYAYRNGRPSTILSDDLKTIGEPTEVCDNTMHEEDNSRRIRSVFRRSQSHERKMAKTVDEKYPLPPSELARRRKPRPLYPNKSESDSQKPEDLLKPDHIDQQTAATPVSYSSSQTIPEPKSPSGLSCAEEFEERVRTLRKLRAEFFAAPPSRHCSSLILSLNRDGSLSTESNIRPVTQATTEATESGGSKSTQQYRSPLHHSQTMREPPTTLLVDYTTQPRGSMPPPPKLSISYYSEDPSIIASPSQVSDALTTWTVVDQDRDPSTTTGPNKSGQQPIPRPRPRPLHGTRRSMTNAADLANKDFHTRHSLLGLPSRRHDRRSSTPSSSEPYRWSGNANGTGAAGHGHGNLETVDSPDGRASYLERSTSRLLHRTSDHALVPPPRSRAASWTSIRVPVRKRKGRGHSETKAIKTLGVIMGCFCLCWVPFFIIALARPMHKVVTGEDLPVPPALESLFLWLGYINSTINPIIYAIFNREFRIPFKEILICRCRGINARLRSQRYAVEYGMAASTVSGMGAAYGQTDAPNPNSSLLANKRRSNNQLARDQSEMSNNYMGRPHMDSLNLPVGYHGRRPSYSTQG